VDANYIYWANHYNDCIGRANRADGSLPTADSQSTLESFIPYSYAVGGPIYRPYNVVVNGTNIFWTNGEINGSLKDVSNNPVNDYSVSTVWASDLHGGTLAGGHVLSSPSISATASTGILKGLSLSTSTVYVTDDATFLIGSAALPGGAVTNANPIGPVNFNYVSFNRDLISLAVGIWTGSPYPAGYLYSSGYGMGRFDLDTGTKDGTTTFPVDGYFIYENTGVPTIYGITFRNSGATVITLASFTATPRATQVVLNWQTGSEVDTAGFNLWRSASATGTFTKLNAVIIPAQGSGAGGASYTWTDGNLSAGQTWYYKLEDIDTFGASTLHGPISATVGATSPILSFQATPTDIFLGGGSLLNWTTAGSPALSLSGIGPVSASSLWVTPQASTSYVLSDSQGDQNMTTVMVKPFGLLDMPGLSKAWGSVKGDANYNPSYDLNGDGKIDDADVALCFKGL
jgi:hypothetical protein